ncbi:hypothetical protein F3Y22_tig00010533pilonHSYRG00411 [Hibiscus syriacus]|uniref:non-specific serine/threonine protein kinase n=1 Tax=Hibiscus syriacus TaxID=106335 RepID=A0A6A3C5F3_HIBSY|nr:hypothetical protein F3Y22_tig00010533pilonHSYRG00411 [Hibiscus syriacus]
MNPLQWLLMLQFMFFLSRFFLSADTIRQHHFIKDNDEMMISSGKIFALGFFGPENSRNRYVGIGYHQIPDKKSPDDPGLGNYSLKMNPNGSPQMFLYKGSTPWWRSDPWTGQRWSGIPTMTNKFILNMYFVDSDDEVLYSSSVKNASHIVRRVTNETGIIEGLIWNHEDQRWIAFYSHPNEKCDFYGHCGPNAYCNPYLTDDFECTCFPGFEPKSPEAWLIRDGAGGCVKKPSISMCGNGEGFIKFRHMKVPDTSAAHVDTSIGLKQCKEKYLRDCSCMAYASAYSETNRGGWLLDMAR